MRELSPPPSPHGDEKYFWHTIVNIYGNVIGGVKVYAAYIYMAYIDIDFE